MNSNGLDEIDNKILSIIKDNARASFSEIGEQVGISRVSVKNRMEAMQQCGVIKGFHAEIDPTMVPDGTKFFLDIVTTPDYYDEMLNYLAETKMIRQIYTVTGDCRIHAIGFASNMKNLEYFARNLYRSSRSVLKIDFCTVLSTVMDVDGGIEYEIRHKEYEHMETGDET